jgi:hypothetical protein
MGGFGLGMGNLGDGARRVGQFQRKGTAHKGCGRALKGVQEKLHYGDGAGGLSSVGGGGRE